MFVPRHVGHCSVRTDGVEHPAHECTAHEHGEHRFPACDARPQQQDGAEGDGNDAGFTDGARNKAGHHIPRELRISARSSGCSQRSGNGEPVYRLSQTEDAVARYPNGITGHLCRIGEEQEGTRNQGNVEHVHTRTAEYFLGKDYRECSGHRQNPQRTVYRHNHRNQDTRNQETFLNFFLLPLGHNKLDAQTHYIRYNDFRQYSQETVSEHFPETAGSTGGVEMLVTYVIHTEQQRRHQRNNHHRHDAFAVDRVVNMRSRFRSGVGHKQECLEAVEHRTKCVEFAALFKVRLYLVEIIS